jgi:hypothetical protein
VRPFDAWSWPFTGFPHSLPLSLSPPSTNPPIKQVAPPTACPGTMTVLATRIFLLSTFSRRSTGTTRRRLPKRDRGSVKLAPARRSQLPN